MIKYIYEEGQTPIDQDEAEALIPDIETQDELNEWEQENIIDAQKWLSGINLDKKDILNIDFIKKLHLKMFDKTWRWAGEFRKNNKNIGVDVYLVQTELKKLMDDTKFWIENESETIKKVALMFHHRMVKIHLFSNGNGRHARIMADLIVRKFGGEKILWHNGNYQDSWQLRKNYIAALRDADKGNYVSLFDLFG